MPKTRRGRALWKVPARGRGTCPICLETRIKLLYTKTKSNGEQVHVCKRCSSATIDRVDQANSWKQPIPYRRKHKKALNRVQNG